MRQYLARRLLIALGLLLAISLINFLIYNLAPGDPLSSMVNLEFGIGREQLEQWHTKFGLDQPLHLRYVYWLRNALQGDLGFRMSKDDHRLVVEVLAERIPRTVELMAAAVFVASGLGVVLGVISAVRQYSVLDYTLTVLAFLGDSTPSFFVALGMIYVLAVNVGWFPTAGYRTPLVEFSWGDHARYLVLPAAALGIQYVAGMLRQTRASMLEVLGQDYIRTARAKGARESRVLLKHAFRNAVLPLVTLFGLYLPGLIGGSIIIETIFAWPGMGSLLIDAVNGRDYNTLMSLTLVGAIMVLITNLLTDIAYAYVDPRIRYS